MHVKKNRRVKQLQKQQSNAIKAHFIEMACRILTGEKQPKQA